MPDCEAREDQSNDAGDDGKQECINRWILSRRVRGEDFGVNVGCRDEEGVPAQDGGIT